ncbi:MAG: ABC transporter permease subunit, partial [Chloroflexota bacterium]|nr:ABC transporter permease subunit [Chloroflexota bacterium]
MACDAQNGALGFVGTQTRRRVGWDWLSRRANALLLPVVIGVGLLMWEALVRWQAYPPFILPGPALVGRKFLIVAMTGDLWRHGWVTLVEVGLGLGLGLSVACVLGYVLGKHPAIERLVSPYIVASQSVPVVAVAPLLIIWFGSGLLSKVLVCALITFFPTLISTVVGLRSIDADLRDLMRSLRANRWQMFWLLELPSA